MKAFFLSLVLVCACISPLAWGQGTQLVLLDGFGANDSDDIHFGLDTRQSGLAADTSYAENITGANDHLTRLEGNQLLLEANEAVNYTAITPSHDFTEGGTFSIDFDLDAGVNDPAGASGDWACVVFGSSTPAPVFVISPDGFGVLFRNNGDIQVFDGAASIYAGPGDFPGGIPKGQIHVRFEAQTADFGGNSPVVIRGFVNGTQIRLSPLSLEYTRPVGFKGNYITLGGSAFGGANWVHAFDNFEVNAIPCIRPSVFQVKSFPGDNSQGVTVTVPLDLTIAAPATVIVSSSAPAVAEPVGSVAGQLALIFPIRTTTRDFNVAAFAHGNAIFTLTGPAGACIGGSVAVSVGPTLVANPSFETPIAPDWPPSPGYGAIDGWNQIGPGGVGVNDSDGPFHNPPTPIADRRQAGFAQGSGGLSQFITGLTPGQVHWLQFRYDARTCCSGPLINLTVRFGGAVIDDIGPVTPATSAAGYHSRHVAFTPATSSGLLEFVTTAAGDRTLVLDAVTIVARGPNQVPVQNPSFEASGVVPAPGVIGPANLSGWTGTGAYGVNVSGAGPFADNGTNPDQDSVAFIQSVGSLSQVIPNLVIGQTYRISYSYNAPIGGTPFFQVSMGGDLLLQTVVDPVGGNNRYLRVTNQWLATATSAELKFEQLDNFGDTTVLLLDDVQIEGISLPPCQITVAPPRFEMFAGQPVGASAVDVSLPLYLVATSSVDVVVRSLDPTVAVPAGSVGGELTLHFSMGNVTTRSFNVTGVGPGTTSFTISSAAACGGTQLAVRNRSTFLLNPSFEDNSQGGVGYGEIAEWTGGGGVNNAAQPFADNGGIPDRTQIAFIQGPGTLAQTVYGLVPGRSYWVQFGYNTRNCCAPPGGTLDDIPLHLTVRMDGALIDTISNLLPGTYNPRTIVFIAAHASGVLEFANSLPNGGDRTLLLDAINIVARETTDGIVLNSSFEGTGTPPTPGHVQPNSIGGWAGVGNYGVNITGLGPFADNGRGPDQDNVAFIEGEGSSLLTMLGPLNLGAAYRLSYSYNARSGNLPHLRTLLDNAVVVHDIDVTPVGGQTAYPVREFDFVATTSQPLLSFTQTAAGDQTVLIDNVRLLQVSSGGVRLTISRSGGDAVRISWPLWATDFELQSTTPLSPSDWVPAGLPLFEENGEHVAFDIITGDAKFYRLQGP